MLKHNAQKRKMEIGLGGLTAGLGLWIVLPSRSMNTTGYSALLDIAPEFQWGMMFLSVGVAHMVAILVNGLRWWTPISRSLMCTISAVLYAVWSAGFWQASPASTAVYTYLSLSAMSAWCFYYAAYDAAEKLGAKYASIRA
jgi:hypothetical protein